MCVCPADGAAGLRAHGVCVCVDAHARMYMCVYMYVYMYVYMCVCVRLVCVRARVYAFNTHACLSVLCECGYQRDDMRSRERRGGGLGAGQNLVFTKVHLHQCVPVSERKMSLDLVQGPFWRLGFWLHMKIKTLGLM